MNHKKNDNLFKKCYLFMWAKAVHSAFFGVMNNYLQIDIKKPQPVVLSAVIDRIQFQNYNIKGNLSTG